jgi:hypothetical protein
MKVLAAKSRLASLVLGLIAIVILLLPFHAFLTVWIASNFGHYTLVRLWKEFLVLICGLIVIGWLVFDPKVRKGVLNSKLVWLIFAYAALDLSIGFWAHSAHRVSTKALAYGLLDDLRFLAFFVICWAASIKAKNLNHYWMQLILWPAVLVIGFGLLQMSVLPKDVLAHFGYNAKTTIAPFQTINNNPNYVRILSTLRGADPLGAYLILPIAALAVLLVRFPKRQTWIKILFLVGALTVLYGSYSRGAWIGALLSLLGAGAVWFNRDRLNKYKRPLMLLTVALVLCLVGASAVLGSSKHFQNIIFHTQTGSKTIGSDQAHLSAIKQGLKQMADHPLGDGPGTAGPGSVYNHDLPASIPENYFLEIGQESGWLGFTMFIGINVWVGYMLWRRRRSPFALTLLVSFIGITFVNLLTLAWTDDTLSYVWWGLAGLAMTLPEKETTTSTTIKTAVPNR